ncbi:hypothetical protein Avbf_08729 [Armadillidium vulgare]|nr:hypothetical protein Avbf_08729 [Armadillidium vulgare]
MCRKIRQKVNGQWRFKRDCARLGEPGVGGDERYCIYRSGTYNIHMEYCTCDDKDGCNTSSSQYQVSYLLFFGFPLLFSVLYATYH